MHNAKCVLVVMISECSESGMNKEKKGDCKEFGKEGKREKKMDNQGSEL